MRRFLHQQDNFGRPKAVFDADVIAVQGAPTRYINPIEHVPFVIKGGVVCKHLQGGWQPALWICRCRGVLRCSRPAR